MRLILGTAAIGGEPYAGATVSRDEARQIIITAQSHGIHHFDTSPAYGNAEALLGELVDYRDTVMSKHPHLNFMLSSLRALSVNGTRVHLMVHNLPAKVVDSAEGWKQLPLWCDGYSAYIGDSGLSRHAWHKNLLKQYDCSIINPQALKLDTKFMARSVFMQGALCGRKVNATVDAAVDSAAQLAYALNLPLPALALHWALQQPNITGVVIGPSSVAELEQIIAWYNMKVQPIGRLASLITTTNMDARSWN